MAENIYFEQERNGVCVVNAPDWRFVWMQGDMSFLVD